MKRTLQPKKTRKKKTHGFRKRMSTSAGKKVLSRRRAKGRKRLAVKKRGKQLKSLKSRKDFLDLRDSGKTFRPNSWLLISYTQNEYNEFRVGLTISAAVANSVIRNKLKRWCKDYCRTKKDLGLDVNFIFLKQKSPSFFKELKRDEINKALDKFFLKIK